MQLYNSTEWNWCHEKLNAPVRFFNETLHLLMLKRAQFNSLYCCIQARTLERRNSDVRSRNVKIYSTVVTVVDVLVRCNCRSLGVRRTRLAHLRKGAAWRRLSMMPRYWVYVIPYHTVGVPNVDSCRIRGRADAPWRLCSRGGFRHVQHVRPNRGPHIKGSPQKDNFFILSSW